MQEQPQEQPPEGRDVFKEFHWWMPILFAALAAGLIGIIAFVVHRLARAAEDARWPDAEGRGNRKCWLQNHRAVRLQH